MMITAIVLNRNNYEDLRACLISLSSQKIGPRYRLRLVVIDNGSSDGSSHRIQQEFPGYEYIFNEKNLGFARSVNQGIARFPDSDHFLLVNNDATLASDCLEKLLAAKADLAGPTIYYKNQPGKIWQSGGYFHKYKMGISIPLKNRALENNRTRTVGFLSGCVLLVSRHALGIIDGFDDRFFFYGEDLDLCLRARAAGLKISYVAEASAWHNIEEVAKSRTNPFVLENLAFSFILVGRKHFPALAAYILFLFIFVYTPFRFYQIIKGGQNPKNILSWLRGGWAGLTAKI